MTSSPVESVRSEIDDCIKIYYYIIILLYNYIFILNYIILCRNNYQLYYFLRFSRDRITTLKLNLNRIKIMIKEILVKLVGMSSPLIQP